MTARRVASEVPIQQRAPENYIGFVGPAAIGLRTDGLPSKVDLLDLSEVDLFRGPYKDDHFAFRGPAIALFFACTGASLIEARDIVYDPSKPIRAWIDLPGEGRVSPRTVPLPELAAVAIRRYREAIKDVARCDRLFVGRDGGLMGTCSIRDQFINLGRRIGIDGTRLASRLRHAYLAWITSSPDVRTATYLRGRPAPEWLEMGEEPSADQKRALIENFHPLGRFDRSMLRWEGAVGRRDRVQPLRELSAAEKKEIRQARYKRTPLPQFLVDAVREAIDAGHQRDAVYAHFGVSSELKRRPNKAFDLLDSHQDAIRAKLEGDNPPGVVALRKWFKSDHGISVGAATMLRYIEKMGLAHRLPKKVKQSLGESRIDPYLDEIRAMIPADGTVNVEAVRTMLATKGIKLGNGGVRSSLQSRGILAIKKGPVGFSGVVRDDVKSWMEKHAGVSAMEVGRRLEELHGIRMSAFKVRRRMREIGDIKPPAPPELTETAEKDVRSWMAENPAPSVIEICRRLKRVHDIYMTHAHVSKKLSKIGPKAPAPMSSPLDPHIPAIRAQLEANPNLTWAQTVAWAVRELNVAVAEVTLIRQMRKAGFEKPDCARQKRVSLRPTADQVAALIVRLRENPQPTILGLRAWAIRSWDIAPDPIAWSTLVKTVCAREGLPVPKRQKHARWSLPPSAANIPNV
ncbi:hypothetical protein [Bradyrhizobium yuanmingense]|uniref:hypothetical protein n=1 Tax=Bradyrhizobium yuanmingense TaxID=108015 RepID=UPI0023B8D4CE|nr:hypothetical protein [Bradyrhizobium yuanmingense]MDF0498255.1 hypothetical protein [Bradyrhizobium yuanmingense]